MIRHPALPMLLLLALLVPGCVGPDSSDEPEDGRLTVFVSIPPQRFFVQRIAGDLVTTEVLLPPGQSPATYEPSPQQMNRLAGAELLLRIGVPFEERLMEKITDSMPGLVVVDIREGIDLRTMEGAHHDHDHGHDHGDHSHAPGAPDPHTWLDPRLAMIQARTIHDALTALLPPSDAAGLKAGLEALVADLMLVDRELAETLGPLRGRSIYVFHPAYGYLADAYGLKQVAVEIEGKEPSARQLAALIARAREDRVAAIFHQPQFASSSVDTLAREIGGAAVQLDPLAEDYLANLRRMAADISGGLKPHETK